MVAFSKSYQPTLCPIFKHLNGIGLIVGEKIFFLTSVLQIEIAFYSFHNSFHSPKCNFLETFRTVFICGLEL